MYPQQGHRQLRTPSRTFLRQRQLLHLWCAVAEKPFYAPLKNLDAPQCHKQSRVPSRVSLVAGSLRACSVPLVVCLLPSLRSISYTQKSYSTRSNATGVCVYLTGSFFAPANNLYTCGVPCSPVQSIQPTQRETHFTQQATGEWNGHSIEYRLCDCLSADLRLSVLPYPTSSLKRTSSQSLDVICFFPVIVLLLPEMCVVCVCVCVCVEFFVF